jgi:hypothetical protein
MGHLIANLPSAATTEGLDAFISTTYYSRIRFILQLMPLLTSSPLPAHVISIYAGATEDSTTPGEVPIGCPPPETYGVTGVRKNTCFMTTFLFEELAEKHAGKLSLSHIFPGLVDGPTFTGSDMPTWFKFVWAIVKPLAWLVYMTSPAVCGAVMVYLATPQFPAKPAVEDDGSLVRGDQVARGTKGQAGGGAYALGQRADVENKGRSWEKFRTEGMSKKVWDHTMEVLEGAAKTNTSS